MFVKRLTFDRFSLLVPAICCFLTLSQMTTSDFDSMDCVFGGHSEEDKSPRIGLGVTLEEIFASRKVYTQSEVSIRLMSKLLLQC